MLAPSFPQHLGHLYAFSKPSSPFVNNPRPGAVPQGRRRQIRGSAG